jgi:hypothetical protein
MTADHAEPSRSPRGEHDLQPRGVASAAYVFAGHVRADPGMVWAALTGPGDPPLYLTWRLRPARGGCVVRLEIDEPGTAGSLQDAEDVWLPVLAALQRLVNTP